EDLPLTARLTRPRAGDLRREDDLAFGRGLGSAPAGFIARSRRKDERPLSRLNKHLRREHDVLVDPARDAREGCSNVIWFWKRFEEVPSCRPQDVDLAESSRLDLLRCAHARRRRDFEAPESGHLGGRFGRDWTPAR